MKLDQALRLAKKKEREGETDEAKAIYRAILAKFPKNSKARSRLRSISEQTAESRQDSTNPPQELLRPIFELYRSRNFDQAQKASADLSKNFPRSYILHSLCGQSLAAIGKNKAAITRYKTALALEKSNADLYFRLGNAQKAVGDNLSAVESFKKAIQIDPKFALAYNNLGYILKDSGNLEESIKCYNKAIEVQPEYAASYYNLGNAQRALGNLTDALVSYTKAIKINPNDSHAVSNLGMTHRDLGNLDEAVGCHERALEIRANDPNAHLNLGNARKDVGDLEGAIRSYELALELKPNFEAALINGAGALEEWNKTEELSAWLTKAEDALGGLTPNLTIYRGLLLIRRKEFAEAQRLLSTIQPEVILPQKRSKLFSLRGKCYDKMGDHDRAFSCFREMNEIARTRGDFCEKARDSFYLHQVLKVKSLRKTSNVPTRTTWDGASDCAPVFLVGFPRSGTTLLDTILRTHSHIEIVEEQPTVSRALETLNGSDPFGYLDSTPNAYQLKRAESAYLDELRKHVQSKRDDLVVVDKMPLNILELPLINAIFPSSKIIFSARHPFDSILSCWMQDFKLNPAMANMLDLERIVELYCMALEVFKTSTKLFDLQVHTIRYEDLIADMRFEIERLLQFLQLNWEPELLEYQRTALNRGRINTPSYSQVVEPLHGDAAYRWKNYQDFLSKYFSKIEPWVEELGYTI